jgi:hypothetical protein
VGWLMDELGYANFHFCLYLDQNQV